jgi:hypothetical protein
VQFTGVLRRSGLLLVIYESHFLFMRRSADGRPAMLDRVHSELLEMGIPLALVTTTQFRSDLGKVTRATGWNETQFLRRCAGMLVNLPEATAHEDLLAVAERALPGIGAARRERAVAVAEGSGRDVSALGDFIRETRRQARQAGRAEATAADFDAAMTARRGVELALADFLSGGAESRSVRPVRPTRSSGLAGARQTACKSAAEPLPVGRTAAAGADRLMAGTVDFSGVERGVEPSRQPAPVL